MSLIPESAHPALLAELAEMHTYMRPYDSPAEREFIARYLADLPGLTIDGNRNLHVIIGESPRVLWSCHTDTVHRSSGRQKVAIGADGMLAVLRDPPRRPSRRERKRARKGKGTEGTNLYRVPDYGKSNCLGADDTVGVFLCRQMILAGISGHYVFHFGEESGCIGSSGLADLEPHLLAGIQIAIAFDRRGTGDVITHQCGARTASDAFARSLADELNLQPDLFYAPDDGGVFTDTNEYRQLIPECSNISVGYYGAHSPDERVDTVHVLRLLEVLCQLDQSKLVVERDPTAPEDRPFWQTWPDTWPGADECRVCGLPAAQDCEYCPDCADIFLDDPPTRTGGSVSLDPEYDRIQAWLLGERRVH